jgi:hypothetical protein
MTRDAKTELRAAWDAMLAELARARDAIDDPALHPPPATERHLAEGYRYLLGHLSIAIERAFFEDPAHPYFRQAIHARAKSTIDHADAIYFAAAIDGNASYVVRGRAADTRHWRGAAPAPSGRKAPQYLIFECASGYAGDSGSLAELRPGSRAMTGSLDSSAIAVEPDGRFEILLAPERPAGHAGNFLATKKVRVDKQSGARTEYVGRFLSGRQLFHDWEREDAVELAIERVGGAAPAPLDAARAIESLRRVGALARGQMLFWNEFYDVVLETYGDRVRRSEPQASGQVTRPAFMPRNALNAPNALGLATGGGQSTNIYAGGVFELAPDEALLIETRVPVPPSYIGCHLANLWGESLDFANHQSSLNGHQAERDADGGLRYVIAHRDPGVPNWLDTTGHREGFMALRWAYTEKPPASEWPTARVEKLGFDAIRAHLPPGVRFVSPEERRERIRVRQAHVQRRYRAF